MIVNNKLRKAEVVALFRTLFQYFLGRTKEDHENPHSV
jgi:uncharacterized membrane protein